MKIFIRQESPDGAYSNPINPNVRRMTRNRKNKQGLVKIEIELRNYVYVEKGVYNMQRFFIDTLIWVDPKNWKNKGEKFNNREENWEYKNNKINEVYANAIKFISSQGQQEIDQVYTKDVDYSTLRMLFPSSKEKRKTFYDYIVEYKKDRSSDGETAKNTVKRIGTVANKVKQYDEYKHRKTYIEDVNITWSRGFNEWLTNIKKFAPSTINRTYEIISASLNYFWEVRDELNIIMNDKFKSKGFKFGSKEMNTPNAITYGQRDILYNHKFDQPYLEKARKMICIQAFTGCRYSDIKRITPKCFEEEGFLIFTPLKTQRYNIKVKQPLHPNAEALFNEVDHDTTKVYNTTYQKYEEYLKEVFQELKKKYPKAKFKTDYTSHNMRDTYISICVIKGVNFKSILTWAGLTKYETLNHYIDTDDEFEKEEMNKII